MQAFNLDVLWYWRSQVQSLLVESAVIQALRLGRSLSSHWFWEGRTESPGECAVFLASEEWWEMLPSSLLLPPTCRKDWRNQSRQDTSSKPPGTQHFWGAPGWKPHNAELHVHATTPRYPLIKHTCHFVRWNLKQNLFPSKDWGKAAGSRSWEGYTEQQQPHWVPFLTSLENLYQYSSTLIFIKSPFLCFFCSHQCCTHSGMQIPFVFIRWTFI